MGFSKLVNGWDVPDRYARRQPRNAVPCAGATAEGIIPELPELTFSVRLLHSLLHAGLSRRSGCPWVMGSLDYLNIKLSISISQPFISIHAYVGIKFRISFKELFRDFHY